MPNLHCELHHRICNLRYGTPVIKWESKRIETLNVNSVTSKLTYFMQILRIRQITRLPEKVSPPDRGGES